MKLRMIFAAAAAFLLCASTAYSQELVDIRFSPQSMSESQHTLFVDVELRPAQGGKINLADQNYRVFYDSKVLKLKDEQCESALPDKQYSAIKIHEKHEHVSATAVGSLAFERDLGFTNFSIELNDDLRGGIFLDADQGWTKIATLSFEVLSTETAYKAVWGRMGLSEDYATAFVELAEWKGPKQIEMLAVNEYFDLNYKKVKNSLEDSPLSYVIGPNPASDYILLQFNRALSESTDIYIKDISGRIVRKVTMNAGSDKVRIDLDQITSSNYILEAHSASDGLRLHDQLVVAR